MPSYNVPPANALLTQNGGIGIMFVPCPFDFKVGAAARVVSDTQPSLDIRIAGVHVETGAVTVLSAQGGFGPNLTAYLVADNARAVMDSQLLGDDVLHVDIARQSTELYADVCPALPDPEVYLPVRLTNGASFYNATGGGGTGGTVDQGMAGTDPWPVKGPLTDTQLRASAVPVSGTVGVSGGVDVSGSIVMVSNFPVTQPVSGPVTDTQLRASPIPAQLADAPTGFTALYSEVTAVASGVETTIISTVVPPSGYRIQRIEVAGDNLGLYRVKVDGSTVMLKRSWWTSFNESFVFEGINGGLVLNSGQVLAVTALHSSPAVGAFEATVLVK